MTSKSKGYQKVCHNVKRQGNYIMTSKVNHDDKKYVTAIGMENMSIMTPIKYATMSKNVKYTSSMHE